jgi:hypothetical protein
VPKKLGPRALNASTADAPLEELAEIIVIGFSPDAAPHLMEIWRPGNPEEAVYRAYSTLLVILTTRVPKWCSSLTPVKECLISDRHRTPAHASQYCCNTRCYSTQTDYVLQYGFGYINAYLALYCIENLWTLPGQPSRTRLKSLVLCGIMLIQRAGQPPPHRAYRRCQL